MLKYQCEECKIETEGSQCPICQGRTKVFSQLYWCDTCNVPLYNETCESCGSEGRPFTTDVRPVFPQERLLIEILLGKPLDFKDKSVWASSGDRYYVNGKKIQFSTNQHCNEDADLVRNEWEKYSELNDYSEFDSIIEKFVKANKNREAFLEDEARLTVLFNADDAPEQSKEDSSETEQEYSKPKMKNVEFTEDEMILLLHVYMLHRDEWFTAQKDYVIELSNLYRTLPIHSDELRKADNFRNPAGIDLQLRSLAKCDPSDYHRQKLVASVAMRKVWSEYANNRQALQDRVIEIVEKYGIDTSKYPTLF